MTFDARAQPAKVSCRRNPRTGSPGHEQLLADGRFEESQLMNRAHLLKRVFDIDIQHWLNCGDGEVKIIAAILERPVIEKILTDLGLLPQPPPKGRAREPGRHTGVEQPWL
jgi:hypothetical protein